MPRSVKTSVCEKPAYRAPSSPRWQSPSKLSSLDLSGNNFSSFLVELSKSRKLVDLGVQTPLPEWLPTANSTRILRVGFLEPSTKFLGLSLPPASCQLILVSGRASSLANTRFWRGCSSGCAVGLVGTRVGKLSRATRREICRNAISVLVDGDRAVCQRGYCGQPQLVGHIHL